jgi:hypothetical protein
MLQPGMSNPYTKNTATNSNQTPLKKAIPIMVGATLSLVPTPPLPPVPQSVPQSVPTLLMITVSLPKEPIALQGIGDVRNIMKHVVKEDFFDFYIFGPTDRKCIYCNAGNLNGHGVT